MVVSFCMCVITCICVLILSWHYLLRDSLRLPLLPISPSWGGRMELCAVWCSCSTPALPAQIQCVSELEGSLALC